MVWRYSSSATVASWDMTGSYSRAGRVGRMRIDSSTRAFVTGASRGIGRALATELSARGATVGLASRSADEALARQLGPRAIALRCDVGDAAAVRAAVDAFAERAGGLHPGGAHP